MAVGLEDEAGDRGELLAVGDVVFSASSIAARSSDQRSRKSSFRTWSLELK